MRVWERTYPSRGPRAALQEADGMRKDVRDLLRLETRTQSLRAAGMGSLREMNGVWVQ